MASEDMSEVVTRGLLKEEFEAFERKMDQKLSALESRVIAEMHHIARFILEQTQAIVKAALEPTKDAPERIRVIEAADLPARVTRLEAKVFPPKRPARRRG